MPCYADENKVAQAIFENLQKAGVCEEYTLNKIEYDPEDKVWILIFWDANSNAQGSDYHIILSQTTGAVVTMCPYG